MLTAQTIEEDFLDDIDETEITTGKAQQAKEEKPLEDSPELRNMIVDAAQIIVDLQADRKLINAQIQEQYERLAAEGVPKTATKRLMGDLKYDQEQRDKHDKALSIARQACGIPVQVDMFQ